ncbi:ABC transporter permease [Mycolicibacterium palauense]|uniref:ABC transporter permease n=1 Tax=Mycolicibacterium palauense TaxID=2034511 RepID=UPI001FE38953|nr:ABC transporter permease [Mycolicibacterium palauense]
MSTASPAAILPPPDTVPAARRRLDRAWLTNFAIRNSMVLVLLLVMAYFSYRSARFATPENALTILVAAAPFALVALGQTFVILTGGIDLSVGSVIAVGAMTASSIVVGHPELIWLGLFAGVGVGLVIGLINGLVVSKLGVAPFVATLGTLTAGSGFAYVLGGGAPINGLPAEWGAIANTQVLGVRIPVLIMVAGFVLAYLVLRKTSFGLQVYAVGGNRTAADVAGVRSDRILISVYVLSGALAGLSGVILSSRVISGPPNLGSGYELAAIAAVVIGGASLLGGRGSVWGTLLGLMLIQTLNNGLDILVVPAYWQKVISGVLIIAAVAVDVWATRRRSN